MDGCPPGTHQAHAPHVCGACLFWRALIRLVAGALIAATTFSSAGTALAAEPVVHIVQPGESLYAIGMLYGVSWVKISGLNRLASDRIRAGQRLYIPLVGPIAARSSAPATPPFNGISYTVRAGDTLGRIAQRLGTSIPDLMRLNQLSNGNRIFPGQVLRTTVEEVSLDATVPGARRILVSISEQRLSAFAGDQMLRKWPVSTGLKDRNTLPGTYSVLNKIPNAYASQWDLQMPNWLGIYWAGTAQNGIHALPILSNGERLWGGVLGSPASYGCIVLGIREAEALYNWAEVGTTVTITP